jgi:pyruvate dehydrogenase E2 component (dihydrolipoamide acetyltransferase)
MTYDVLMPRLSETVQEGVLVAWFVDPGSVVKRGDLLAEVQVEKSSSEVHAQTDGRIAEVRVQPGGIVAQGAVMAVIDDNAAEPMATTAINTGHRESKSPAIAGPVASPAARRLARELGVNLAGLQGTGPAGRIVEADVRAAAAATGSAQRGAGGLAR